MDWKSEAIEKLKGYTANRQPLDSIPPELKCLSSAYAGIRSTELDDIQGHAVTIGRMPRCPISFAGTN